MGPAARQTVPQAQTACRWGTPPQGSGSGGTIHAGAGRVRNTRSATAADAVASPTDTASVTLRGVTRPLVRLLVVGTLIITIGVGYVTFRIWQQGQTDEERHVDAIVVLGAAQYDGRPSPLFRARLDHSVDLYRAGGADRLPVAGGQGAGRWTAEGGGPRAGRQGRGRVEDGGSGRAGVRTRTPRAGRGDPRRGRRTEHARVAPGRRDAAQAQRDSHGAVRLRQAPHAARVEDRPRSRDRGVR